MSSSNKFAKYQLVMIALGYKGVLSGNNEANDFYQYEDSYTEFACADLPGAFITCGSHCYPNCGVDDSKFYNHYIVVPEASSCYIDSSHYGKFDSFVSRDS